MNLLPFFAAGLAASVHCVGMCGGIAAALGGTLGGASVASSAANAAAGTTPGGSARPLVFQARHGAAVMPSSVMALTVALPRLLRIAAFNAGRIASYVMAGAMAGGLAGGVTGLAATVPLQQAALLLANLMLLAVGLYLMDAWRGLAQIERIGHAVWRRLQPLLRMVLPMDSASKALAAGALWGWLPCGLVYSMLVTAMLSGSSVDGACIMLAFGLGTAPLLFATGLLGMQLRRFLQQRAVRLACGLLVMAFGALGVLRLGGVAIPGLPALHGWDELLCIGGAP